MAEEVTRPISEMIDDDELMTEAILQGVREELLSHARAGNSVPVSENGQIVWLSPDNLSTTLLRSCNGHQSVLNKHLHLRGNSPWPRWPSE
jgi:hypothetical protein